MRTLRSNFSAAEAVAEISASQISAADEAYERTLGWLSTADEETVRRYVDYITGGDEVVS